MEQDQEIPENRARGNSLDDVWQIDSEWINLSSSSPLPGTNRKGSPEKTKKTDMPSFHFIPSPSRAGQTADRYLVIDQQALRLSETKSSGHTYWVCSIPCCTARCILDPSQRKIVRICREHSHEADVSRQEYKNFIQKLKVAVRENPHVKPNVLYQDELEKSRQLWLENHGSSGTGEEPQLPTFDAVRNAMHNSRNAVLSSLSLRAAVDEKEQNEEGATTPEVTPPGSRSSRSTRSSRDGKKKSPATKSLLRGGLDSAELVSKT